MEDYYREGIYYPIQQASRLGMGWLKQLGDGGNAFGIEVKNLYLLT